MSKKAKPTSWRDAIKVHPAAELFPLMTPAELKAPGEDIEKNGLTVPVVLWRSERCKPIYLLDGRNRLDAMEAVGIDTSVWLGAASNEVGTNPYATVLSGNIHRRHLTAGQKRALIAKVLKATPEKSNRQIAKQVKSDDKTVAAVRSKLEATAELPQLAKTVGADGKARTTTPKSFAAEQKAKQPEQELPPNDVEAAENAAAQFLCELEDLDEEFERINQGMDALCERLCASLDMREGETFAECIRRHDPERRDESDKSQVLIACIASALRVFQGDDLHFKIQVLDHLLAWVLEKRSASTAQIAA